MHNMQPSEREKNKNYRLVVRCGLKDNYYILYGVRGIRLKRNFASMYVRRRI